MSSQLDRTRSTSSCRAGPLVAARRPFVRWAMLAVGAARRRWPCPGSSTRRWRWTSPRGRCSRSRSTCCSATPGLLSFGHAAFWGTSAYVDRPDRHPRRRAVPGRDPRRRDRRDGAGRPDRLPRRCERTGIYFAMVTLAFAQMIYFIANQWRVRHRRRERPAGHPQEPRSSATDTIDDRLVLLLLRGAADHPARGLHRLARRQQPVRPGARRDPRQPGPGAGARLRRGALQDHGLRPLGRARRVWPAACSRSATASRRCRS